jgi:16S rRNA C967 or C1407 C5-methylase (RsmB/RsmF family)
MASKEYNRAYYLKNKDKFNTEEKKAQRKKYYEDHKEWFKEYYKKYFGHKRVNQKRDETLLANGVYTKYHSIKARAKIKNIDFNIEYADIVIPDKCPLLGVPFEVGKNNPYNPSVDRIDPTKGYVKGNIEVISELANRMKSNANKEQLVTFATNILNRYK